MADKVTIDIALQPLAWKVLRNGKPKDGSPVDLENSWIYSLILQSLEREQVVVTCRDKSRMPKKLEQGKILLRYEDMLRHGRYIRATRQWDISRLLVKMKREMLCQAVAVYYIATGIDRNKVMRHFLDTEDIDEEEISFEALKKHYQRHYRHKEESLLQGITELRN